MLDAKRKHEGTWRILGKIVTVSEMYMIEVPDPTKAEVIYKDAIVGTLVKPFLVLARRVTSPE